MRRPPIAEAVAPRSVTISDGDVGLAGGVRSRVGYVRQLDPFMEAEDSVRASSS